MKSQNLGSFTLIRVAPAASLSLHACNTAAGFGKDVSAEADSVTDSAEESKED